MQLCLTQNDEEPLIFKNLINILPIAHEHFAELFSGVSTVIPELADDEGRTKSGRNRIALDSQENTAEKSFSEDGQLDISRPIATDYFQILLKSMNLYKSSFPTDEILIKNLEHEDDFFWRDLKVNRTALKSFLNGNEASCRSEGQIINSYVTVIMAQQEREGVKNVFVFNTFFNLMLETMYNDQSSYDF